ncbi:MAG: glutathione ABC transporter substrate-binding protein [Armatimonadota bacterium]|nr:glutathione ABC transporter substrate-binding protein [Armatimonadota bacterium]MDR7448241.1 glutathione ABC transporter substrate-binding protein [Armatimonadota bacterium]MDR7458272.1 glutathione ABC transporter substrate-binding protein [Armatimonadota bacterium]MDR7478425.1 glutathione ABC transporter substrate-binding protein [Armatimonadota bacterium]MDR7487359.1 glutathione ABC transporter substrate-binding protein [Armatimonadota bacterium]
MRVLAVCLLAFAMLAAGAVAGAAPAPARGGTLIIAEGSDATTLDGHRYTDSPTAERMEHICETLFWLSPEGRVEPRLATAFTFSPDGRRLTIRLRPTVRFHDGTPFNAQAAKWNLDRVLDPATRASFRSLIDRVTQVVALDANTLVLLTNAPFAPLVLNLTHGGVCMQSPTAIERLGPDEYARNPVGTGPYRFREWVRGDRITVTRFEEYWGEKGHFDAIQWRVIPDDGARVAAVESGAVHIAKRVPPRDVERLRANRALRVEVQTSLRTIFIGFNVTRPPFNNRRVRQALNYAINKEAIVRAILGGTARVSDAPIAPGVAGYARIMTYEYNVERARQLLAEAGYPNGFRATLHHPVARYIRDAEIAAAIQGLLRRVGVEVELVPMDIGSLVAFTNKPQAEATHQMYMLGWGTVTGDADYGLYNLFHSSQWPPAGFNRGFYRNPQVDALLDRGRTTLDQAERNRIYREAMALIMEDAPWIFLHSESQVTAYRAEVQNVYMHPAERLVAMQGFFRR